MAGENDGIGEALDAFKAKMVWSQAASDHEKSLVIGNLAGFADHLRRAGFFSQPPHPENCNHPCCD